MSNSMVIVSLLFIGLVNGYPVIEDEVRPLCAEAAIIPVLKTLVFKTK